jgi:molybdopterin-synthase adenylyltransferase
MRYSAALTTDVQQQVCRHLIRRDRQEDLCFAIWYPSRGRFRFTALVPELVPPLPGERAVHGNASFTPEYFDRAVGMARERGAGLAILHSHLGPGWQDMSHDDITAEEGHAASTSGTTGLPLVGMTLGTDGALSVRMWERTGRRQYARRWCESVRLTGEYFGVTYNDHLVPVPEIGAELDRTVSAWGEAVQANIGRLRVGVVGAGSVGCIVAEALARMGFGSILLLDFDMVERVNLDRLLHATHWDVGQAKVRVLARALRKSATTRGFTVEPMEYSVSEEIGYRAALDCDVLFSCVDRPLARHVLNFIAYTHLIPVVDGGIAIRTKPNGTLRHCDMRTHIAAPTRRCLECMEQYNAGLVSADREGYLDDSTYVQGLPADADIRHRENVFGFSAMTASLELMHMLAMVVVPCGIGSHGAQIYHFKTGDLDREHESGCNATCLFPTLVGRGDAVEMTVTGPHRVAEGARASRRGWWAAIQRVRRMLGVAGATR